MRHSERTIACLTHLSGVIPIWGALFMGIITWRLRERSRPVVFHSQQALFFHLAVLALYTGPILLFGVGRLLETIRPELGLTLQALAKWMGVAIFAANAVVVLVAANNTIEGRAFEYPYFGRKLRPFFDHE